jgi:hypothetical protein
MLANAMVYAALRFTQSAHLHATSARTATQPA